MISRLAHLIKTDGLSLLESRDTFSRAPWVVSHWPVIYELRVLSGF